MNLIVLKQIQEETGRTLRFTFVKAAYGDRTVVHIDDLLQFEETEFIIADSASPEEFKTAVLIAITEMA